jgi:RNA recognition motif-containing protein
MGAKVFVGGIDFRATEQELTELFRQAGNVQSVIIPTDRETGRSRGFAFVEFDSEEGAKEAITKFDGKEVSGRPLRVNAAEDRPARPRSFGGPRPSGGGGGGYSDGGGYGGDGGYGGGGGDRFGGGKPKGSRRNVRAKKRSL